MARFGQRVGRQGELRRQGMEREVMAEYENVWFKLLLVISGKL
jgi:hypothetical protein|nr:hypothetical protein Q903MT_gene2456 [Picea sitchensis]